MAKRKYTIYQLNAEYGEVNEEFYSYKEAYSAYCKERRYKHPATLYGIDEEGHVSVIKSNGDL